MILKKIIFLIVLLLVIWIPARSQNGTSYTQFYTGMTRNNPAMCGIDPFLEIDLGYKQAWKGFSSSASHSYIGLFGQISKGAGLDAGKRTFRISDPSVYRELKASNKVRRKHGIGLTVNSIRFGMFKAVETKTYYAFHIPFTNTFNLSMGLGLGLFQQRIDFSNLQVRDQVNDIFYQNLMRQVEGSQTRFLIDFGLTMYSSNLYVSLTGRSLVDKLIGGDDYLENFSNITDFGLLSGIKIPIGEKFELHPDLDLRYSDIYGLRFMTSARVKYNDLIYVGGGFQNNYRISVLLGIKVLNTMYLHYSYDYYKGFINKYTEGTHELTLAFTLFNRFNSSPVSW